MTTYRTPGVYVEEVPAFPPSVTEVETAIPAFIGHTGRATRVTEGDLRDQAVKIHSFAEFERYYGAPAAPDIDIALAKTDAGYLASVNAPDTPYILYYAVKMYFDNGGGKCYIVSIGDYENDFDVEAFARGLRVVADEDEPTLLICPEADRLDGTGYKTITQAMLAQCGRLKDRFAIIDLFGGDASTRQDAATLSANRARLGNRNLQYGALYYPHVRSSFNHYVLPDGGNVSVSIDGGAAVTLGALGDASGDALNLTAYDAACKALQHHHVVVPASGAVAGIYAATDAMRGVWKAPANASLADVVEPVVKVENAYQDELNIDVDAGKSINAIRAFAGKGTLVWGARTLAGNDNEWRYVPDPEVARRRACRRDPEGRLLRAMRSGHHDECAGPPGGTHEHGNRHGRRAARGVHRPQGLAQAAGRLTTPPWVPCPRGPETGVRPCRASILRRSSTSPPNGAARASAFPR